MPNNQEDSSKISVLIDTSPMNSGHSIRGIGAYTRHLTNELKNRYDLTTITSSEYSTFKDKPKIDLIHYPYFDLFYPTLPLNITKTTVVTIHDVIPLKFPEFYLPGIKGKINFERQKLLLKNVNAVITDSHSSKKDIVEYLGIAEQKIHVIYLAANPELKSSSETEIKKVAKKYNLPKKYVLYVGDINYNKNIPQLIKMVKFLPGDIDLVCVGSNFREQDIPEWRWIETQVALSDVSRRVHFLTEILTDSIEELSAIYSGAVCYIQPSLWEGFGLPILEAMQCRTPVVSSNLGSLPEIGGEYANYSEPKAEEMATMATDVLNWSKTKRLELTRSAYAWSQSFSWQKTADQTIEVYNKITK